MPSLGTVTRLLTNDFSTLHMRQNDTSVKSSRGGGRASMSGKRSLSLTFRGGRAVVKLSVTMGSVPRSMEELISNTQI